MAMSPLGKALRALGTMREYENGPRGVTGFVWRWWNPLVWIIVPLAVIVCILLEGIPETFRYPHQMGFTVDPYYKKNGLPVRWLSKF